MTHPLVSIIVTNYNYGAFLDRCLSSILNQTYKNIELIICDNNSTDNSHDVINKYLRENNVVFLKNFKNTGPASNYLRGRKLARGSYIMNFGADDYMDENFIEHAINLLETNIDAGQLVCHCNVFDDNGKITPRKPFFDDSYSIPGMEYAALLMVASITQHTSQTLFAARHLKTIEEKEFYSATIGERAEAMNLALVSDVIYLHHPYITCRESSNSQTALLNGDTSQIIEQWSLINNFSRYALENNLPKINSRLPQAMEKLSDIAERLCCQSLQTGNNHIAGRYFGLSLVISGFFDRIFDTDGEFLKNTSLVDKAEYIKGSNKEIVRRISYPAPSGSSKIY